MCYKRILTLLSCVCLIGKIGLAQDTFLPPSQPEIYPGTETTMPIIIDGQLNELAWSETPVIDNFIQQNPKQGAPSSYPTEVKILYNQHGLYIGAICFQPESQVVVKNLERDFNFYQNDLFGVAIDGLLDKRNSLVFQVTPLGTLRDLQVIDGENENTDWNVTWNAKTTILEDRWIVEMVIPWNIIRYANNTDQLGVVFARNIRSLNEFSSAPAVPRSLNVYRMEYEALLTNLVSPPPSTNIQINPYALGDLQYVDDAGNTNSEFDPKIGGDIKWGISTNSVLDLTFNTDFAQAEADAQVVNLNRFSVFFPERRQFFLENSDLFSPSITNWIRPFFSRRIGLNASGRPIPIDAGARFVSQSSDHRLGSLIIRQREFDGTPASNFGVLRYSRNLSAQSRVGSMVTFRNDQSLGDTPSNNNFTYTVDGLYRPDPSFGVQGMITGSQDDITGNGLAGQLWAYYENNLVYIGLLEYYNRNYNPGMGLEILNDNYVMTAPAIFFDFRPDWLPSYIRSYNPGFYAYIFNSSVDGKHLFSYSGFRPVEFDFQNGANFYFTIEPNWQSLEEPFFPVGIEVATGNYQYVRYYLVAATNPASVISATFNSSFGEFYDGSLERYTLSGRVAPIPHIEFEGSYQLTRIHNLGINAQDDETYLIQFGPRLALNPRLLFSGLYQWNSASDRHLWNTRVSWEFMPLSFVYLVFNSSVTDTSDPLNRLNQQQYIAKVSYVHQF